MPSPSTRWPWDHAMIMCSFRTNKSYMRCMFKFLKMCHSERHTATSAPESTSLPWEHTCLIALVAFCSSSEAFLAECLQKSNSERYSHRPPMKRQLVDTWRCPHPPDPLDLAQSDSWVFPEVKLAMTEALGTAQDPVISLPNPDPLLSEPARQGDTPRSQFCLCQSSQWSPDPKGFLKGAQLLPDSGTSASKRGPTQEPGALRKQGAQAGRHGDLRDLPQWLGALGGAAAPTWILPAS